MKKIIFTLITFTYLSSFSQYTNLVWSDEFDGNSLNLSNWSFDNGDGCPNLCGWGNGELEYYTDDNENISVADGILTITAVRESIGNSSFSSSKIVTLNKQSWRYGRFEARMKMPLGNGLWPAFWMLHTNNQWPTTGEIDIMEFRGDQPRTTHGTLHYGAQWPDNRWDGSSYEHSQNLSDDFHVYAVEWDENSIKWYFDNILFKTETKLPNSLDPASTSTNVWPWDTEFYIILNLAVGGLYTGTTDPNEVELTKPTLEVDYIRVYSEEEPEPLAVPGLLESEDYSDMEGIATEDTEDTNGGQNIGFTDTNDWFEYDINVEQTADYNFTLRTASEAVGGNIDIELDGIVIASDIDLPVTGGWQIWTSTFLNDINLTEGDHTLRVVVNEGLFNINYIDVVNPLISSTTDKSSMESISIYPTSFKNETQISVKSSVSTHLELKVFNQKGIEVFNSKNHFTNESFSFGSNLNSGMYFIHAIYDEKISISKIIKL